MATANIRVDHKTYDWLKRRAKAEQKSIGVIVSDLVMAQEQQEFRDAVARDFARLREDPEAWTEYKKEFEAWDVTLLDGLEDEPAYYDDTDDVANG
jgi:hypothetical protein